MPAQRRVATTASAAKKTAGPKCSGAWTGVITYTRSQAASDTKTVERVSGRGKDTRNWQMNYSYSAQVAVVETPEMNGSSIGKATINMSSFSKEKVDAVEKNSCDRGKTWRDMRGTSTSNSETTGQGKEDANVTVGVNSDGTYTVSVGVPQIKGYVTGEQSSSFSGQCTPKEGKTLTLPSTETTIEGNSLTSDGTHRINPDDPNRLSGTYSHTWQNVTEKITWNLQKCGAPLRLLDLKFEDMKWPNWNDWQEISEQKGTIDGNLVRIKARVLNASGETKFADIKLKETYKGDKWDGAKPDGLLNGGEISVRLDAGEEKEVEIVWDSSGYAWFDDGRPRLLQRIKAELEENGKKTDELTKNLKVAPKPVVLVHGLWSNWKAWEPWQNILTTSHSYDWKAFPVGEKPEKGVMNTGGSFLSTDRTNSIFENSQQLGKYLRYAQEDRNAWHVDVVAHSMGGLITRHYIHQFMPTQSDDGRPQIAHLVMLGTPNMGSPCADVMNTAFEFLGKDVEAVRQLRQDVAAEFNRVNVNRKGVKFSVLAGDPLPTMCKTLVWNDGVVPVPSAIWQISDNAKSKNVHTELTGTADFSSFVKPRLAIGPKGNHMPEVPQIPTRTMARSDVPRNYGAMFNESVDTDGDSPAVQSNSTFAKAVKLAPKQTIEIEIPIEQAANVGLTFMAISDVSATLFDAYGVVVGKNHTDDPEANQWFRSIFVNKPTTAGTWKLRLQSISDRETEVIMTSWSNAAK
ncbi:MAG TPA: alpha/beta hydrolase [Pyrinomonadaceae bacterium]|nr:alpha/beta hydrolase [Pyrinomonadaceae bacterium]